MTAANFTADRLIEHGGRVRADALVTLVHAALAVEAARYYADPPAPTNARNYLCGHPSCSRAAVAKKLCNAHLLRKAGGRDMDAPFFNRRSGTSCAECGQRIDGKGAWHLCRAHYRKRRLAAIKGALVTALGGQCARCEGIFPLAAFDFHHIGQKDASVSALILNQSIEMVCAEVEKCVLLCANCHRVEHGDAG